MSAPVASVDCRRRTHWVSFVAEAVRNEGYCVVENVLDAGLIEELRAAMYRAQKRIVAEVGAERLRRAGEIGVLRLMMKFEPTCLKLLEIPEMLAVVEHHLGATAVLHLQNGFILPSSARQDSGGFQTSFHQDFPRVLNGYLMSINAFFALDDFHAANGATWVVPGTHQRDIRPADSDMQRAAVCVECAAGAMIVFDSTLWHCGGPNTSGKDRLAVNHQFTRSYVKQQIDYVRALGDAAILGLPARSQQQLGYYTRVVTSLDEYYRPAAERLYRSGQG
jgi:ectoine hydroxylase-related dioxygenase (phytanoyl-CoA dioxygenase family)